jgi:regulator of RNase E activity RraA
VANVSLNPPAPAVDPAIIAAFRDATTPSISDNLDRLPGLVGLRPFHRGGKLVGTAFTVQVRPGDVLVVAGGGDTSRALVGDIMKAIAESRGCAGFVIDGAIRDTGIFAASDFPCYARAAIHRGPYKQGPGATNIPVSIGGWTVDPGDVVVGDEDGVVTFPASIAPSLIEAVRAQDRREAEVLQMIREGRYDGRYGKVPAR